MLLSRINVGFSFSNFIVELFFFNKVFKKKNSKNSKKIMKSVMGIPYIDFDPLWPLYKYP